MKDKKLFMVVQEDMYNSKEKVETTADFTETDQGNLTIYQQESLPRESICLRLQRRRLPEIWS